jgi:predicted MFS family arabinose efflux permease
VLVAPSIAWLIEQEGWRTALMISGAGLTVLLLPLAFLVRPWPGADDVEPGLDKITPARAAQADAQAAPLKVGAILRAPQFWSISIGASVGMALAQTLVITLVPLARESGFSMMQAASLLSVIGGGAIVGALAMAAIADKLDRILLLTGLLLLGALLNAALLSGSSYPLLLGCAALLGVSSGAVTPGFFALLADRFGPASFGTVRGLSIPVISVTTMITVRFAGEVFDRTGGYDVLFRALLVAGTIAAGLMFSTRFTGRTAAARARASAA